MSINPYESPEVVDVVESPPITAGTIAKAWIVYIVLSLVGWFVAGVLAGFIVGAALGAAGAPRPTIRTVCSAIGFLISIPISYASFHYSVRSFLLRQ
jgi:hypothetical protein